MAQMIAQQRQEREAVQYQLIKLYEEYDALEELEQEYQRKHEEFEEIIQVRRKNAKHMEDCLHPPCVLKEFSGCLSEKLYGSEYEIASENVRMLGEEITKEKQQLSNKIAQEEAKERILEQRILALEKLMI